jgi:hypothetical protein
MRWSTIRVTVGAAGAILLASCGASGHIAQSATSKAQTTAKPAPVTRAVPAAVVTAVKTPVPFTPQQLIAVARKVYQPYPAVSFGTCDYSPPPQSIPAPAGRSHYANCPFTASLNARYVAVAPAGRGPEGSGFLCACLFNSANYTYSASTSVSGGIVIATPDGGYPFRLTIVGVAGVPKVNQIEEFLCFQGWYVLGSQPPSCAGRG